MKSGKRGATEDWILSMDCDSLFVDMSVGAPREAENWMADAEERLVGCEKEAGAVCGDGVASMNRKVMVFSHGVSKDLEKRLRNGYCNSKMCKEV